MFNYSGSCVTLLLINNEYISPQRAQRAQSSYLIDFK